MIATLAFIAVLPLAHSGRYEPVLPAEEQRFAGERPGAVAAEPWWRSMRDPDLEQLVERGLAGNHDLAAAWSQVASMRALRAQAGSMLLPTASIDLQASTSPYDSLGFQFGGSGAFGGGGDTPDSYTSASAMLGLGWQPDIWGQQVLSWRSGRYDHLAAQGDRDAAALSLGTLIAGTWYDLVAAGAQLQLLREQRDAVAELLELSEQRYEGGEVTGLDVLQQRQQLAGSEALIPTTRAQVVQLEQALRVLLGEASGQPLPQPPDDLPALPPPPTTGLPLDLLENRPDLRAAEARYRAGHADAQASLRSLLPSLALSAQAGRQYFVTDETSEIDTWTLGGSLSVPLWQARGAHTSIQTSLAAEDAAAHALSQAVLAAIQDVESSLALEAEQLLQVQAYQRQVEAAQLAWDESREQYLAGHAAYLSVLSAQQAWQQSQLSLLVSQRALLSARISTHEALGGGWTALPHPTEVAP